MAIARYLSMILLSRKWTYIDKTGNVLTVEFNQSINLLSKCRSYNNDVVLYSPYSAEGL